MSFKSIAQLILAAGLVCSLSCKDSGTNSPSTSAPAQPQDATPTDVAPTPQTEQGEAGEAEANELTKESINQDAIKALLGEIPKDALFAMVARDFQGLHDSQIEGLTWESNLKRLKNLLPSDAEDDIIGDEVAQGRLLLNLLASSQDGACVWAHPDSIELFGAQAEGNQIAFRYMGWGLGHFLGVMLVDGLDADLEDDQLPFQELVDQIAERIKKSDRPFGVTVSLPERGAIEKTDLEVIWDSLTFQDRVSRVKFEEAGVKWAGIQWSKVEEEEEEGMMLFDIDPVGSGALQEAILTREPVLAVGERNGRQVWYYGTRSGIDFAESESDSLLSLEKLVKVLDHCPAEPAVLTLTSPELVNVSAQASQPLSVFADEYIEKVVGGDLFSDRRVLTVLGDRIQELAEENQSLCDEPVISVVYADNGIVYEQYGGPKVFGVDYETPQLEVAPSELSEETWLMVQGRSDPKAKEVTRERFALLASLIDLPLANLKGRERDELVDDEIGEVLDIYYSTYRQALLDAWSSLSNLSRDGLGDEWVILADTKGAYPQVPGWPEALIDEASAPRFVYSAPVKNREVIGRSWETFNDALNRSVIKTGEVFDVDFTMLKPISDEGDNGVKNYYYAIPLTSNECLPCLSLNDSAFAIGTSKKINLALINAWNERDPKSETFTGLKATLRITPLRQLVDDLVKHGELIEVREAAMNDDFEGEFDEFDDLEPESDEDGNKDADELETDETAPLKIYENILKGTETYESIEMSHFLRDGDVITRIILSKAK